MNYASAKLSLLLLLSTSLIIGCSSTDTVSSDTIELQHATTTLFIPPLLDYTEQNGEKDFTINVQEGNYEFVDGVASDTYGYNGDILGPTIRMQQGDKVNITVNNNLDEQTTTHWHGGVVPGDADGGVHNIIPSGEQWVASFDVIQEAATLWYHPHQHEETARQVYQGLGGMIIVDDENSAALNIPQEYGVDDIPLILQSKDLTATGELDEYSVSHHEQIHGFEGNTLLVNAQIQPEVEISTNLTRFRLLNGSNSDIYSVSLSTNDSFYVIASDGGFYNAPIEVTELEMHPAKRYEILVDSTKYAGEQITLDINDAPQLTMNINKTISDVYSIPTVMNSITEVAYEGTIDREFDLELLGGMGMMGGSGMGGNGGMPVYGINGELFDMERIDFTAENGTTEYWKITNIGNTGPGLFHPFHVHATQFSIVEFNDEPPSLLQQGRHDTIVLDKNDSAIIAVPFDASLEGTYMYHCHILEHEDAGMMGQFELTPITP